jgi:muconolactone delta-isomerase
MDFLVEFEVDVPDGTLKSEVEARDRGEASAAAKLVSDGHLLRIWKPPAEAGETKVLGLYRADSESQLHGLLSALPLYPWMRTTVTPLEAHPNDPGPKHPVSGDRATSDDLPAPALRQVYRLEATLAKPLDLGETAQGRRRIVALTGGTFTGPDLNGTLLPGVSADWQLVLPDGTVLGDIRYTLETDAGDLIYVKSYGIRHGSAEVLARLARGEEVDAREYMFRTATRLETAAPELDWLNKGVFVSVGGRQAAGVVYETYLVA